MVFAIDFESYTVNASQTFFKKLNTNVEIGIRKDGIENESSLTGNRLVGNVNANYSINDRWNVNSTYSNFKNVERNYFQSFNSLAFDSLSISLLNQNFNISTTYTLGKSKKSAVTLMYSNQMSNRIQSDSLITNSQLLNHLYTANYSFSNEKFNVNSAVSYMQNKTESFTTKAFIPNFSLAYTFSDKIAARSNITYNHMISDFNLLRSLSLNQDVNYQISKNQTLIFTNRWNFNTSVNKFKLLENLVEMDYTLKF